MTARLGTVTEVLWVFSHLAEVPELGGAYVYVLAHAASYNPSIDISVHGMIGYVSRCYFG